MKKREEGRPVVGLVWVEVRRRVEPVRLVFEEA